MEKIRGIYTDKRVDAAILDGMMVARRQRYLALPHIRRTYTYQRAVTRLAIIDLLKAIRQQLFSRHYKFLGVK